MNRPSKQRINYLLSQACEEVGASVLEHPREYKLSPTTAFRTILWELKSAVASYQITKKETQHPEYKSLVAQMKLVLASPFLLAQLCPIIPSRVRLATGKTLAITTFPYYDKTLLTPSTQELLKRFLANLNFYTSNKIQEDIAIIFYLAEANRLSNL